MGAFLDWLERQDASCCPDPEPCDYCGDGKHTGLPGNACENCMNTGLKYPERQDDAAITEHGYDSRCTPIDTLMAGPVQMHLDFAEDMENGPNRDWSREYENV
jgi:hypothetical protein